MYNSLTMEDAEPLYLDFAHDYTILFALSTLGLNKLVATCMRG